MRLDAKNRPSLISRFPLQHIFWVLVCLLFPGRPPASAQTLLKGFHAAGVPAASYKDGEGFAFGGNLFFYHYGEGVIHPFKWSAIFGFKMSTKSMISTYIFYDRPQAFGPNTRFSFYIEYKRYLADDYYGLGNKTERRLEYTDPAHPDYREKRYYSFKQRWPSVFIYYQAPSFLKHTRHFFSFGFYDRKIEAYPLPNKLREDSPLGVNGGKTHIFQVGLIYDTRDEEAVPHHGAWSEVLAEFSTPLLGSSYEYIRLTMTDRRYYSIHPRIVYAQRLLFEPLLGQVPFYDMATINGSYERHTGLGGATSMRGIPRLMFVGQHKLLGNFELRVEAANMTILKQPLAAFIHFFVDAGRVWLKDEAITLRDLHASYGAGLHIRWKKDLVGAIDIGRSRFSNMAVYITFRNLF